ncbi:MAG: Fic family protein, partial [Bdellovibrionaceae bacterium]|nr:Fic family protein [Pseudobdellovibrionaceae bacterium]
KKFMQAIEARGGVQGLERLSLSKYEMDTLNQLVDRVPMYARQLDPALPASLRPSRGLSNAEGSGARVTPAVEAPSPAVDPSLTRLSAKDYGRPVFTQKATIYQNGRETNVSPIRYDVEMAASAKLDVSEVMALRRNFDSTVPETGETGLFRVGDDVVIDPNTNIVAAYKSFTQRLESGAPLTGQDFIDVRKQAYSVRSANVGEGRTEIPFQFKNKYTATIPAEIPPYVRERLSHYGIEHRIENGQTKIIYPDAARGPPLDRLADDVNRMIAEGQPPERVTAFMAQDLLILHPFKDGNGRTARLMAQGMYRKMTGRDVVFPEQFKREMEYSVDDLARSILPPRTGVSVTSRGQNIPLRDIEMEAWRNGGSWPRTARLDEVQSPAPRNDVAFPNEINFAEGFIILSCMSFPPL